MTIDTKQLRADAEAVRDASDKSRRAQALVQALVRSEPSLDVNSVGFKHARADAQGAAEHLIGAKKRLYASTTAEGIILALLDEVDRLNHALALAYPRALQVATNVVRATFERFYAAYSKEFARLSDIADDILALSAEQIERFDGEIQRAHAAAVEASEEPPKREVVIWHHRDNDEYLPSCGKPDDAVQSALCEYITHHKNRFSVLQTELVPDEITIYGYARMEPCVDAERLLDLQLEYLDEDYSDGEATKATPAMIEAAEAFAAAMEREYVPWACEVVETRAIDVREWCAVHAPEWLAQLSAIEPVEGSTP